MTSPLLFPHLVRAAATALLLAAPAGALAGAAAANPTHGGNITVVAAVKQITAQVTSPSPELATLMQAAFRLHGGFHLNPPAGTAFDYTLRFEPAGTAAVAVIVTPRGGAPYRLEGAGGSLNEAAYRAGDAAVKSITGKPGFFAGKLVFVSQRTGRRELFASDLLGQSVRQLTQFKSDCIHPRWSPDGTKILFTGYHRSGFPDIMLLNLATGELNDRFAAYKGTNTGAVFSPDGTKVAMILSATGSPELYVSGADGKNPKRLTNTPRGVESSPAWSQPDGARLVFANDERGSPQLYTIAAGGGGIAAVPTRISGYCAEPASNPTGNGKIAFTAAVGSGFQIAVYDPATRQSTILPSGGGSALEPVWANDGIHVIFTRRSGANENLAIVNTETGQVANLTTRSAAQADFVYPR